MVFWVFEVAFDVLFDGKYAKYIGAVFGLTIGYTSKFYLDRKFVFRSTNNSKLSGSATAES